MRKTNIALILAACMLCSCNLISSVMHDGELVAKAGKYKLYLHEVEQFVPAGSTSADSTIIADNYIMAWVTDHLLLLEAEKQLSKEEIDVSRELEAYRIALVKYRYEQRYVSDRLDTLVTSAQIEEYYNAHMDDFRIAEPLLKVRFIDMMADSPAREELSSLISAEDYPEIELLDSLAAMSALRYFDNSDRWTSSSDLALEFGMDVSTMLSLMRNGIIRLERSEKGDVLIAYVSDILRNGTAPLEYCTPAIRDIIISSRKHALLKGLEQDLLDSARENNNIEIIRK